MQFESIFRVFFTFGFTYTAWLRADVRKPQARGWLRQFGLYWTFVESTRRMALGTDIGHPQSHSYC